MKVKILGICGSPRRASTELAIKESLKAAEATGYAETEFFRLDDYNLQSCKGCWRCMPFSRGAKEEIECYGTKDDTNIVVPKLLEYDGYILGYPIFTLGVPGTVRNFMVRAGVFGPMAFSRWLYALKERPIGIINLGGVDLAGQEATSQSVWDWALAIGLSIVGAPPTVEDPLPVASVLGGLCTTVDSRSIYAKNAVAEEASRVSPPTQGMRNMRSVRNLGRSVTEVAMYIKAGRKALEEQGITTPPPFTFPRYSIKPEKGTYLEKLVQQGKVKIVDYATTYEEQYK